MTAKISPSSHIERNSSIGEFAGKINPCITIMKR